MRRTIARTVLGLVTVCAFTATDASEAHAGGLLTWLSDRLGVFQQQAQDLDNLHQSFKQAVPLYGNAEEQLTSAVKSYYQNVSCVPAFDSVVKPIIAACANDPMRTKGQSEIGEATQSLVNSGLVPRGWAEGAEIRFCGVLQTAGMAPSSHKILLNPRLAAEGENALLSTLAHELYHRHQHQSWGSDTFKCRYVKELARTGSLGRANAVERDAYRFQDKIAPHLGTSAFRASRKAQLLLSPVGSFEKPFEGTLEIKAEDYNAMFDGAFRHGRGVMLLNSNTGANIVLQPIVQDNSRMIVSRGLAVDHRTVNDYHYGTACDVDRNGMTDLLLARTGSGGEHRLVLQDQDGNFEEGRSIAAAKAVNGYDMVVCGEFHLDGHQYGDFLFISKDGSNRIIGQDSDGNWEQLATNAIPPDRAAGFERALAYDFDGNGLSDVLLHHRNGRSLVALQTTNRTFGLFVSDIDARTVNDFTQVVADDVDGDGFGDLIFADTKGWVRVLFSSEGRRFAGREMEGYGPAFPTRKQPFETSVGPLLHMTTMRWPVGNNTDPGLLIVR